MQYLAKLFVILFFLFEAFTQSTCLPAWFRHMRRPRNARNGIEFRIKGLQRGMLEVSSNGELKVRDWESDISSDDRKVWFTFCFGSSNVVQEIGHVSALDVCQANHPNKKIVYDRSNRRLYVREPEDTDEALEAVIYEHQKFYLRPKNHHREVLVAELEGSYGSGAESSPDVLEHLEVVKPRHLTDIENNHSKHTRWEIKVRRSR